VTDARRWICCQLGAREHYAVPRALHRRGQLHQLITDAWVAPGSTAGLLPGAPLRRFRERFHPDLQDAAVTDFTASLVANELGWRIAGLGGWDLFLERNRWFQDRAADALGSGVDLRGAIVFAHSYAALEIARLARLRHARFVLGQIDPGLVHFRVVQEAAQRFPEFGDAPPPPPAAYLDRWREECDLADRIIVNSEWSRACLQEAGVPSRKIHVVPLAYEPPADPAFMRRYPDRFTASRPLRVLYVGQVTVAKGAAAILESLALLEDVPLQLRIVGAEGMTIPARFRNDPRIEWRGAVPRSEVMQHYRDSDVLLFPTLSDGFGMAMIEARGWRLPIIASRRCGSVVADGVNGLLLDDISADAIASAVRAVSEPAVLQSLTDHAGARPTNSIDSLASALLAVAP
jgi:glycosyltransferase involved in cell wall biosynthesis